MSKPWRIIDSVETSDGILELRQRSERDFLITIAGRVLMNSSANRSEIELSQLACNLLLKKKNYRVLIGGLGMGYSLKSALDNLPGDTRVVVAELNPIVVKWCREPLSHLTEKAVDDPRVAVKIADVSSLIRKAAKQGGDSRFDAIILDLYEGPFEAAKERSEHVYGATALELSGSALMPGGVLAVWSEDPERAFEKRLLRAGFSFERKRAGRGGRHVVYIARMRQPVKHSNG
jgi:spermidine synthase